MIKRNEYKEYNYIENYSTKNEPLPYRYPDMKSTYDKFSEIFDIPKNNFILTNGCENAFRIALLATRIKEISIETPGWELAKVIADSLDIKIYPLQLAIIDNKIKYCTDYKNNKNIYITDRINNFIYHPNYIVNNGINIIDETYTQTYLYDNNREINFNKIIIGSFSKIADPSLRLGYILYNKNFNDRFQQLREQYISGSACKYINSLLDKPKCFNYNINGLELKTEWYQTVVNKLNTDLPYKEFKIPIIKNNKIINEKSFYRYGVIK